MSTKDNNSINHNKDYDDDDYNNKICSDSYIANKIFNTLSSNGAYKDQAIKKFEYFRIESPDVWYVIDIKHFSDEVKSQLEYCLKDCNTVEEKYCSLDKIFVNVITLIYKNIGPQILADKKDDRVAAEKAINEISSALSHQWMLVGSNKTSISSSLDELIRYKVPISSFPSSSSADKSKEQQDKQKINSTNIEENNQQQDNESQKEDDVSVNDRSNRKKKNIVYKYTLGGRIHESIILKGHPVFLNINENNVNITDKIDETTRILAPPATEEYPSYFPYFFENKEDINNFFNMINDGKVSIDTLFDRMREYISKFIVHHDYVLDYIAALILFSYFQDFFPTVPYTMFVSDNGSGKSTIGNVFEFLGYRCVNMTDPTTANLFRIFGTIEAGQCILVLDEAEKIDQNREMMSILKSGYENGKKVQRINPLCKQEHFHTYGLKIMLGERTPHPSAAKGVLDRTFIIHNYAGIPELDIKEIKNAPSTNRHKTKLLFLRKAMLVYRLQYSSNGGRFEDIETGLKGRDKELCKPLLQLFYGCKSQKRIERALEILLDEKKDRKANSLDRDMLEVVTDLFEEYPDGVIPNSSIWDALKEKTNGHINSYKSQEMETETYGTVYKSAVNRTLRDRFGAKNPLKRKSKLRSLMFDIEETKRHLYNYTKENNSTKISCSLIVSDSSDSSDSNSKDLFSTFVEPMQNMDSEMNETHDNGNCNVHDEKEDRELETDIDFEQMPSLVHDSNILENRRDLPDAVTAVTAVTNFKENHILDTSSSC